ncbi:MerR family DNA-binding protein [Streptomyces sp. NPDC048415]|uniref:MerR family DNA-binding protein n=1 Tax=Streptomyces sp. NPDC048415 TaxID=3154822 RepID=UPI00344806C3
MQEVRQILSVHGQVEAPCGHVRQVLDDRLEQVRAQIAEPFALEGHLETLIKHARQREPADHANVCWIIETKLIDIKGPEAQSAAHEADNAPVCRRAPFGEAARCGSPSQRPWCARRA